MPGVFFQSDIDVMCEAISLAERNLTDRGCQNYSRESIAATVIRHAMAGELNPARLAFAALDGSSEPHPTMQ
jgi:hypothetical protein